MSPSNGDNSNDQKPVPAPTAIAERLAVLDELVAKYRSLSDPDSLSQNREMASYLASRPEFVASGAGLTLAWAMFADGRLAGLRRDDCALAHPAK